MLAGHCHGLPMSEGYNAICTIIDRLYKERHYVLYYLEDKGTSTEELVGLMLWNIFRPHGLPSSITSDQGPQFISNLWRSICKRLKIKANLSTAYHPETDGQTEQANQDVERGLRTYYNYMQDNWVKWLPIVEFSDNNNTSSATSLLLFYLNKGFHPRMSFDPDTSTYKSTRKRLQSAKAEDITTRMQEILNFERQQLKKSRESMKT